MTDQVRPLLIGESPSRAGDRYWQFPLSGNPAVRICRVMGWPIGTHAAYWALAERFETANAIERHADAVPWNARLARERCEQLVDDRLADALTEDGASLTSRVVVVCLGRRAAEALGIREAGLGAWTTLSRTIGPVDVAMAPHTSGRNREWNVEGTEDALRRVLTEAIARANGR